MFSLITDYSTAYASFFLSKSWSNMFFCSLPDGHCVLTYFTTKICVMAFLSHFFLLLGINAFAKLVFWTDFGHISKFRGLHDGLCVGDVFLAHFRLFTFLVENFCLI